MYYGTLREGPRHLTNSWAECSSWRGYALGEFNLDAIGAGDGMDSRQDQSYAERGEHTHEMKQMTCEQSNGSVLWRPVNSLAIEYTSRSSANKIL